MQCPMCKNPPVHFCYTCGRQISGDTLPAHYAWWNLAGCPNQQMTDAPTSCCGRVCQWLYNLFMLLVVGPIALILTLLAFILCPCVCIPLMCASDEGPGAAFTGVMTLATMLVMGTLMVILALPVGIIAFVFLLLCCPCLMYIAATGQFRSQVNAD